MKIELIGPVYPINQFAMKAFAEILNTLQISNNIADMDWLLCRLNKRERERKIYGYFKWSYDNKSFNLWQRTSYFSEYCFPIQILKVDFSEINNNDKEFLILN